MTIGPCLHVLCFVARAIRDPSRKLGTVAIDDAHDVHRREVMFNSYNSGRKQAGLALSDCASRSGIHDDPPLYFRSVGNPSALAADAFRWQETGPEPFTGKDTVQNVLLLSVCDHRDSAAVHGNLGRLQFC